MTLPEKPVDTGEQNSCEPVYVFDTTLRDGAQTRGVTFSIQEKLDVIAILEHLGIDYIEGGWPGANPTDTELFSRPRTQSAKFVAFGMTRRAGVSTSNDPGLRTVIDSSAECVCLVAKTHDYHVEVALRCTLEENLKSISESVAAVRASGKEPILDCEHFFDGIRSNRAYSVACARAALMAGARWIVLCDTNGGSLPADIFDSVKHLSKCVPVDRLGIHCHNDMALATANTLAAVDAGVRHIQGTLGGIGERCGNADLFSIIPTLMLKPPYKNRLTTNISRARLAELTSLARRFDDILNRLPVDNSAYVGPSAFAHKGGLHASALIKNFSTYEHIDPIDVGNIRHLLVSDQSGRSNLIANLDRLGLSDVNGEDEIRTLIAALKEKQNEGYSFDTAEASLVLFLRRKLDRMPAFFQFEGFRVLVEHRYNALGSRVSVAEATIKVRFGDEIIMSVAEGNGPVHALDRAIRKDLGPYADRVSRMCLADFKVRIIDPASGTRAKTRVLIESHDHLDRRWWTVGISSNVIDASFEALVDALNFQLLQTEPGQPEILLA